jgi:adenylate cyclase
VDAFPDKLRLVMEHLNFSRVGLAQKLAVDKTVIGRWLSGVNQPTNHNLTRLTGCVRDRVGGFTLAHWNGPLESITALFCITSGQPLAPAIVTNVPLPHLTPAPGGAALEASSLVLAKPSIAVLPFANLSPDPEQGYFADGIANDIIAALSRYPSLLVIARNSSFSYKGINVNVQRVGRELGVRYVLEGSLRKGNNRVRVMGQLIEAETSNHLWAEHYDRELSDIFAVQDEIAAAVATAVAPAIADAELRRALRKPPESLDAWAAYQRGLWHLSKSTAADNVLAEDFLLQATALDPTFAGSYGALAFAQLQSAGAFQRRPLDDAQGLAEASARRAVGFDGADPEARSFLAWAFWFRGDYDGARAEAERALVISPNLASAHGALAVTQIFSGRPQQGLVALNTCIRLDPRDPILADRLNQMAVAFYFAGDYEAAIDAARHAIRRFPNWPHPYRWLAASLGQAGRTEEATEALDKAITIGSGSFDMYVRARVPWHRAEDYEHMLDGLRKAGWRE